MSELECYEKLYGLDFLMLVPHYRNQVIARAFLNG